MWLVPVRCPLCFDALTHLDEQLGRECVGLHGWLQASTLNELNQNHHDRNDQQHVNESAQGVRGD